MFIMEQATLMELAKVLAVYVFVFVGGMSLEDLGCIQYIHVLFFGSFLQCMRNACFLLSKHCIAHQYREFL
jgi:intracellular septation protein A